MLASSLALATGVDKMLAAAARGGATSSMPTRIFLSTRSSRARVISGLTSGPRPGGLEAIAPKQVRGGRWS